MKTKITNSFFLLSILIAGFVFLSGSSVAQQKPDKPVKAKKTITIHVTREVDGNKIVIDTTVVTDGDFDADAFLAKKGVLKDGPEDSGNVERRIIIRHHGEPRVKEFSWSDKDLNLPDTIKFDDRDMVFSDKFDRPFPSPHEGMPFRHEFRIPEDFSPMPGPQFEDRMEEMLHSFGLENVMPFGEMKQVVVKKKRNGKKVIITFEDRKGENPERSHGKHNHEKVIIYNNGEQGLVPQNDEHVIVNSQGENMIINKHVVTNGNQKTITVTTDIDKSEPVNQERKVIIIKEDDRK